MFRAGDCKLQQALLLRTPLSVPQTVGTASPESQQAPGTPPATQLETTQPRAQPQAKLSRV